MKSASTYFKFMKFAPYARLSLFMLLKHKSIFFAKKDVLNDPTDCSPFLYVDLDSDQVKRKIKEISLSKDDVSGYWSHQASELLELIEVGEASVPEQKSISRRRSRVYFDGAFHSEYSDEVGETFVRHYMNSLVDDAKIFSMARVHDEPRLWAHYADSHRGFCVELSGLDKLPDSIFSGRVDYTSRRPRLSTSELLVVQGKGNSQHKEEILSRLYLQKSLGWEYEKEHRLVLAKADFDRIKPTLRLPEGDYIRFEKIKIERIILGINASG